MSNHLYDAYITSSTLTPSALPVEPVAPEQLSLFETLPNAPEGYELYVATGQARVGKSAAIALRNTPPSG
jgi:hypothetical protein